MAETNRIEWLDVARGLAIFFVIFGHASIGPQWLLLYAIPLFYMAMFFFVSGYLFKEKSSFSVVFEQRTRTVLLPYLFWGVVAIFIGHAFGNPPISIIDDFQCFVIILLATIPVLLVNRYTPFLKGRGFKLYTGKKRL